MSTTAPNSTQTALEAARARVAAEQEKVAKLQQRIELAEAFKAEAVTLEEVAEKLGVTTESARAALVSLGAITPRRRTITFEETEQALDLLKNGARPQEVAEGLGVVETIIRKLAREHNLVRQATRRSPETMEKLAALEEQVKGIYGAGFAALGEALRKYRAEQAQSATAAAAEPSADDLQSIGEALGEVDLATTELPPPVAPPPVAVPANEPVGLSPEDAEKMAEPDAPEGDISDWD